jgi:hypothetical protein
LFSKCSPLPPNWPNETAYKHIRKHKIYTSIPAGAEAIRTPTSNAAESTGAKPLMVGIVSYGPELLFFFLVDLNYPSLFALTV